ncbi:hypothetical protein V6N13_148307 [Hibiscus sabdariffa]
MVVLREWETIHKDPQGTRSSCTSASSRVTPATTRSSFYRCLYWSRQQTGGPSTSAGQGLAAEGPSTVPYTPMPPVFSHASSSQFQSPMAPPTEGFFIRAFQPYSSMMTAPLHSSLHFFPPPHQLHTSVHTPKGSLFAIGPSGSGHYADDDEDANETEEEEDDDDALVRRNLRRNRRVTCCGTGGYRRHKSDLYLISVRLS